MVARSLRADMQAELREIERAAATGTREAGRGLKPERRRQVGSAGLGQRLANSWRDKHYPNQKLDAASLVYTRAPQIILSFDEGAVIRSRCWRFQVPDAIRGSSASRCSANSKIVRTAKVLCTRACVRWRSLAVSLPAA
jgi:Family of unknown function (DUF6441)